MEHLLIEVGAFDGSDSLRFYNQGYEVFTFEPKDDLYENLKNRTSSLKGYNVIKKAVSLIDGTVDFNICVAGGASSILKFKDDSELNQHWGANRTDVHYSGNSYKVESTRLDTFIEEANLQDRVIDYIHIDAQGVDLDVLKSLGKYIENVKAGVIETVYSKEKAIYENQENDLNGSIQWLEEHNFTICNVEQNDVSRCECNIHFVRKQV